MKIKDLGEPLYGSGNVFHWADGQIIKLHAPEAPREFVVELGLKEKALFDAGVPVADVGELVEIEGHLGQVYEKVEGKSIADLLLSQGTPTAEKATELARIFAETHANVHAVRNFEFALASQKEAFTTVLNRLDILPPDLRDTVLNYMGKLPDGNRICHGDFHPYNVIISERGPIVIDWPNSHLGNPLEDVARTKLMLTGFTMQIPPVKEIIELFREVYLARYFELTKADESQIEAWWPVVCAVRLADPVPELYDWLLEEIKKNL